MGILGYIPVQGKKIYLKCSNANGIDKQFELPQTDLNAYSLTTSLRGKRHLISIQKSIHAPDIPLYVLAHCRGEVLFFSEWDKNQGFISFSQEQLPAGVIQFILFDAQMNPLSERLVFNKNDGATAKVDFFSDKKVYEKRDKVIVTLTAPLQPSPEGREAGETPENTALPPSLWGRVGVGLSVAITDDNDFAVDSTTTILSTLLLSSELKGYIENPAYYFQDNNESATALNYLMLTHGWRRYKVPEVVKGQIEYPYIPFQTYKRITGKVTNLLSSNPVAGSEIILMTKYEGVRVTTTDVNGLFVFQDIDIPDSASFFLQALNRKGRSLTLKVEVDQESFPELTFTMQNHITKITAKENKTETRDETFLEKSEQRAMYDDDIRLIHLEEVVITAPRNTIKRDEPRLQFWANQSSDVTLRRDIFEKHHRAYVSDYLWFVGGVYVSPEGYIKIRGGNGKPLILIDGLEQDWPELPMHHPSQSPLERVTVNEIESIDVFKGFGKAMFGMQGANGVISITTKRGEGRPPTEKSYYAVYTPLGYQKPVDFYSPKYETLESKHSVIPDYRTTIFWKPDIVISEDAEAASFEFYTADFKTTYSVVIEGLTSDGRIVRQVETIRVE